MLIHHSQPTINPDEATALARILRSNYLAQGQRVRDFEESFARFIGVRYGLATNSGTSALHLALLSLGAGPTSEVILPSYVCSAVLNAVNYTGARPILTDIDESDFNISLADTRRKITKRTKAIIVPHLFGFSASIKGFLSLGVPIIEDCAHSIGATCDGKKLGSFGTLAIFSFYATKMMTTAYGGMVTTNSNRLSKYVRNLRDFDNRNDYITRYNYQMSDLQAALGQTQLKQIHYFIKRRRQIARFYNHKLAPFEGRGFLLRKPRLGEKPVFYRYPVRLVNTAPHEFIRQMRKNMIEVKLPVYKPLHRYLGLNRRNFPVTESIYKTLVSLPIYPNLTNKSASYVTERLLKILYKNPDKYCRDKSQ